VDDIKQNVTISVVLGLLHYSIRDILALCNLQYYDNDNDDDN